MRWSADEEDDSEEEDGDEESTLPASRQDSKAGTRTMLLKDVLAEQVTPDRAWLCTGIPCTAVPLHLSRPCRPLLRWALSKPAEIHSAACRWAAPARHAGRCNGKLVSYWKMGQPTGAHRDLAGGETSSRGLVQDKSCMWCGK